MAATRTRDVGELTDAAMAVALSIVLGNLRLLHLPNGGSIDFGALPLLLLALVRGWRAAFFAGWCAGLGQALVGGTVVHPVQYLLDYGLAFAVLAVAAVVPPGHGRARMAAAVLLACAGQYAVFVVSGVVFFATYAGATDPLVYSLVYNAVTSAPEALLAAWTLPVVARAYARGNPGGAHRLRRWIDLESRTAAHGAPRSTSRPFPAHESADRPVPAKPPPPAERPRPAAEEPRPAGPARLTGRSAPLQRPPGKSPEER